MQSTMMQRSQARMQAPKCAAAQRLAARPLARRANVPRAAAVEAATKVSEEQIMRCVNAIR